VSEAAYYNGDKYFYSIYDRILRRVSVSKIRVPRGAYDYIYYSVFALAQ